MIFLDTSFLRSFALESVSTDLLKVIRAAGVESVGVSWVVLEELISHRAVPYYAKYIDAAETLKKLDRDSPYDRVPRLSRANMDGFRKYWRAKYLQVVEEIPTSEEVLRQAIFREANVLPPCKIVSVKEGDRKYKIGCRDAAIWLTAIEYLREHPGRKVYFVSKDWDFGKGDAYPYPMNEDLKGFEDRFIHLTSLEQVVGLFATETEVDEVRLRTILNTSESLAVVKRRAKEEMFYPSVFQGRTALLDGGDVGPVGKGATRVADTRGWMRPPEVAFRTLREPRAYSIGEHVWCIVTVRWVLAGVSRIGHEVVLAATAWETSALVGVSQEDVPLTLLRSSPGRAVTMEEWNKLSISGMPPRVELGSWRK